MLQDFTAEPLGRSKFEGVTGRLPEEVETSTVLEEQLDYYRARAAEYDQWWLRQGRYDRGPTLTAQWFAEAAEVQAALVAFQPMDASWSWSVAPASGPSSCCRLPLS